MACAIISCDNQGLNFNFYEEILKQRAGVVIGGVLMNKKKVLFKLKIYHSSLII